jgi:magnesium chelatase subunit I
MATRAAYPFSAIVGQDQMKLALILNTISPGIGGVLIRGEKGTAKSTAVRALARLLPDRVVVRGCRCGCLLSNRREYCTECAERYASSEPEGVTMPMEVVELPLNSTEDRVSGTLDLERAISEGRKSFEPGILARANGNILYVDEVNLLDDHIVDLLLDSAAMGVNYVEREGVSFQHPSSFILVGTMNPEEGDLRPQLLDRFGLMVDVVGETDEAKRKEIIRRRLAFERDRDGFIESYRESDDELRRRISEAKANVDSVSIGEDALDLSVRISIRLGIDGHRADLTMIRAACALAAWEGRGEASADDVAKVAPMVLAHRMRKNPFDEASIDAKGLSECLSELVSSR